MEKLVEMVREAGSKMTYEEISKIGKEAEVRFGINKDTLMLLFLSGKKEFKDQIFEATIKRRN